MLSEMWTDILLQAFLILTSLFAFLFIYNVPQNLFSKLRHSRSLAEFQAKRHFVTGAKLLSQARSQSNHQLAKSAVIEADKAIALDPKDAAAYLLKAVALELQGFKTSAIDSIDLALMREMEDEEEKANALFKRAELRVEVSPRAVEEVVGDLVESVRLNGENVKAVWLLGRCYEKMGLGDKAKKAYQDVLKARPGFDSAQKSLDRLLDC